MLYPLMTSCTDVYKRQPSAYKDVSDVVQTVHDARIARKVVRVRPIGVIKG